MGLALGGALAVVLVASGVLPPLPDLRQALEGTADGLGPWIWPFMSAIAFLETTIPPVTLLFPGEWVILFGGAIAGQGEIPIVPLVLLVWVSSIAGDSLAFLIGRRFGRQFLVRYGARLRLTEVRLARVDRWFERYGAATIALGRLVPFARPTAPIIAGSTRFPYPRFLRWNVLGTALFSLAFCLPGYFFYRSYDQVAGTVGRAGFVLLAVLVATAIVIRSRRRRAAPAEGGRRRLRVLLSDGSGLTARQVATHLGEAGHEVHLLSPDRLCLARWTRHVRRVHSVPAYGRDPYAWLERALDVARDGFDVLLPTQEQVAVLAREVDRVRDTGAAVAVPPFDSLSRVQDKVAAHATLTELGLRRPSASIVHSKAELLAAALPAFVKTSVGTASTGVSRVASREELDRVAGDLDAEDAFADGVVVQDPVEGPLVMVQAVFREGRLVATHANLRERAGASGGASSKRSVHEPRIFEDLMRLGSEMDWHGALSLDAVLTPEGPSYIDINPRLVEPGNARRAGVDLVDALLGVTLDTVTPSRRPARTGVATHQLLIAILGAAQQGAGRRGVLRELLRAVRGRGPYRGSSEELTPLRRDPRSAVPVVAATAALVVTPRLWRSFATGAVSNYALTPGAWRAIRGRPSETIRRWPAGASC